jgi:hypothetical protein
MRLNFNTAMEDLEQRGIFNDVDIDYLNHLKVDIPNEISTEGVVRAVVHDNLSLIADDYRNIKGWFLGIESKRKYIEEICDDLIDWLKDKDIDEPNLDLDMGTIKTWMKTSETFFWRYYFLLNDKVWSRIESDLKSGDVTSLEVIYDLRYDDRTDIARYLDSVLSVKLLIKEVIKYKERSNKFFELIVKRKIKIKATPFQVILLGAADLRRTVKKIVNLAI